MGFPKPLENILNIITASNNLQSWSIFQEKDGSINVKLKFNSHEEPVNHIKNSSYKKKTNRQVERDFNRSRQWRASRTQQTRETIAEPTAEVTVCAIPTPHVDHPLQCATPQSDTLGVKTRSMTKGAPEVARSNDVDPHTPLNPEATSFTMPTSCTPGDNVVDVEIDTTLSPEIQTPDTISLCDEGLPPLECSAILPDIQDMDESSTCCEANGPDVEYCSAVTDKILDLLHEWEKKDKAKYGSDTDD